jgi:hypothetical protein
MHPRPPLTPEEDRTIRHWSFAMAVIYFLLALAFFASIVVSTGPAPEAADTAAAGKPQKASGTMPLPSQTTADRSENAALK